MNARQEGEFLSIEELFEEIEELFPKKKIC